jgi:hypothetical protein
VPADGAAHVQRLLRLTNLVVEDIADGGLPPATRETPRS